jgi:hypothetical protein
VRRLLLIVALLAGSAGAAALFMTAFGQTSQPLRAPASMLHEVDGVTMMAEKPCDLLVDACSMWMNGARHALNLPASAKITRVSLAETGYTYGGFSRPLVVVLDLDTGGRRAVTLICGPNVPTASRDLDPATCRRVTP